VVAIGNHLLTKERLADLLRSQAEFFSYFTARIDERRSNPLDDLLTDVVEARMDGTEPLTTHEMLGMLAQFLVAGNETTTKLLASAMLLLTRQPELMSRLRADHSLIPGFIEEALRLEAPVQGLFRMANIDTEVGGVPIPAGSSIWVLYASANRDDAEFEEPDRLDPSRANAKLHLAFGQGIHYCIGASLSRAEGRIAFEVLLDRFEDIALAPGNSFEFEPSYALHGLKALHLEVRART
jgi:cytochrome P450